MSWRQSGGFRPSKSPSREPRPEGSGDPPLLTPALQALIVASLVIGLVGLGLMVVLGGTLGQGGQTAAQPPAAPVATAPSMATAAPDTAQPTAAPDTAQPTAAPTASTAGGAAGIPTEPYGPAIASGSGTAVTLGTAPVQLVFDQDELTVPNGLVTLTFQNQAQAVQHNWVLVDGDDEIAQAVDDAAADQSRATRRAEGSVPPPDTPGLLAASPMLNPGDEVTLTFQPPGPGSYVFLCTFPGHYLGGMRGTLIVEP